MKKLLLLKSLFLLCALVVGSSAWADGPVVIYSETFGSPASNTNISSFTGWSATASMFNLTGTETVASCYSGNKVGTGDASTTTDYTAASGSGNAFQQGTANTTTTILTVQKINISGKTSLSFNAGLRNGGAATYIKVYYQIDNGTKTEITLTGYGATTGWHYVSGSISGTGTNLKLFFEQTPTKGWTSRIDDIKVTGVSGGGSTVITPTISPASGAVASGTEVTITCDTEGASIYYTTNGNTPSSSSTPYNPSSKPTITAATTIKAIGIKDGLTDSEVATASYTIAEPCATPTFSVAAGAYTEAKSVEIACATEGATIHYTTDGTVPTSSSPTYSSALSVRTDKTIKAIAIKDGYANSNIAEASYTFYVELPFKWDNTSTPIGVTNNNVGTYPSSPFLKFDNTGDYIILKFNEVPGTLSFDIKGNTFSGGTFKVQASADGSAYSDLATYTTLGDKQSESFVNEIASNVRYIKWIYTSKDKGNVALGNIKLVSTVALTPAKTYTTLTSAKNLDFTSVSSDLKAYIATEISAGKVQMTQVNKVPAGTGLVLKATTPGSAVNVPVFDGTSPDDVSGNKMAGSATATTAVAENGGYILSDGIFQPATAGTLAAGKAYLNIAVGAGARALEMNFDDNETTAVNEITNTNLTNNTNEFFDLQGRKVAQPTKGLYIVNGKKVIIK